MEWSEEQAAAAERKVQENSSQRVCPEKQGALARFFPHLYTQPAVQGASPGGDKRTAATRSL